MNRFPEVALLPLRICQRAFIENLEKQIQHLGMRFLVLVEQHDAVGMRADRVAELAALGVADVSRRRADQFGNAVLFLQSITRIAPRASAGLRMFAASMLPPAAPAPAAPAAPAEVAAPAAA